MSARIKLLTSAAASSSTLASSLSGTVTRHRYDLFVADGQGGSPASHHEHRLSRGQRHGDLRYATRPARARWRLLGHLPQARACGAVQVHTS